jgi:hypothetical protein
MICAVGRVPLPKRSIPLDMARLPELGATMADGHNRTDPEARTPELAGSR